MPLTAGSDQWRFSLGSPYLLHRAVRTNAGFVREEKVGFTALWVIATLPRLSKTKKTSALKKTSSRRKRLIITCLAPARLASNGSVPAMGVGETADLSTVGHRLDSTNHDQVRQDLLDLGKTAVEYRGRSSQRRSAGYEPVPFAAGESFVEMMTGTAGENVRESLVRGGKGVDATPFSITLAAECEVLLMQNNIMGDSTMIDATEGR